MFLSFVEHYTDFLSSLTNVLKNPTVPALIILLILFTSITCTLIQCILLCYEEHSFEGKHN